MKLTDIDEEEYKREIGNRLARLRSARNWSQTEMSKILRLSKSAVSMYERGDRYPSILILRQYSEVFGVTVDYLVGNANRDKTLEQNMINTYIGGEPLSDQEIQEVGIYIQTRRTILKKQKKQEPSKE